MKKTRMLVAIGLVLVMVLAFAAPAFAKGGGGGGRGGGGFSGGSRSFSGGTSKSYSSSTKSYSSGTKSVSTTSRSYSAGYSSTTKPTNMTGFKTYTNTQGKTVYYMPKTYASSPRTYYDPMYGYGNPYRYYYVGNTGSDFWFWMWMMGRNNEGVSAPQRAVETTGTNDAGQPSNDKVKAVKIPEESAWGTYSTGDKVVIGLLWTAIVLGGVGLLWCLFALIRLFLGYKYKFRFWRSEYSY